MSNIFISYRRDDSADVTGRIGDRLRQEFGNDNVFTDVDDIPLGVDFRDHLDKAVSQCAVLLVVIGRDWLSVVNKAGEQRLFDPADFVRVEIESALNRGIPVIPLLVSGASIPEEDQLPDTIKTLAFRNAHPIRRDPDFNGDVHRLVRGLVEHLKPEPAPKFATPSGIRKHNIDRATQINLTLLPIGAGILVNAFLGAIQAMLFRTIGAEQGFTVEQMDKSPLFNPAVSAVWFAIGALITFGVSMWVAVGTRRKAIAADNWRFYHDPESHVPQIAQALKLVIMLFSTTFVIQLIWMLISLPSWGLIEPRDQSWWAALRFQATTAGLLAVAASLHGLLVVSLIDLANFDSSIGKWLKSIGAYIVCMAVVGYLIGYLMPGSDIGRSVRMAILSFDLAIVTAITGLWLFVYLRGRVD